MNTVLARHIGMFGIALAFSAILSSVGQGQYKGNDDLTVVEGTVCDSQNRAVEDANVSLESADQAKKFVTRSDSQGLYRFEAVPPGSYTVRASKRGYQEKSDGPFAARTPVVKKVVLQLVDADSSHSWKEALSAVEFSDEPRFTVAGVTDPSNLGGHGSDTALRTREALAKDTASLNHEGPSSRSTHSRDAEDAADAHAKLADVAERTGRSLEAVQEYQRAAELEPSETHLFAWGAELLLHRAFDPAIEVFAKGHRNFPNSVRMFVGLSVATYDQGATEQGEKLLLQACDLNPSDPTPYLFLGRLQEAEKVAPPGWTEKLQWFASVHPENALAHYYFAAALSKRNPDDEGFAIVESELKKALERDPQLGKAYLQLGILYSAKKNIPGAIRAFQKAIENMPLPDEAHYRLAQLYRQTGEAEKAREETARYSEISQRRTRDAEQRRHEIQQFVYTLRGQGTAPATPEPKPQ